MSPLPFLVLSLIAVQALFAALPGLDLWVATLFYAPGDGFWMARNAWLVALRGLGWNLGLLLAGVLAVMVVAGWLMRLRTPIAVWGYGLAALLLGPGLLVNGLFKSFWGRARPSQIVEFGGQAAFTPPLQLSAECLRNCSFTSGEGALAITVALILWRLAAPRRGTTARIWIAGGLLAYAVLLSGLRIAFGGHFLSDTVFSALICGFVCVGLGRLAWFRDTAAPRGAMLADLRTVALLPLTLVRYRSAPRAGSASSSARAIPAGRRYLTWTGFRFRHP